MNIFSIAHKEFNEGNRSATKALVKDVISVNFSRNTLVRVHRVSSNKITDMCKFIRELNKGLNFEFRGVSGYTYRHKFN